MQHVVHFEERSRTDLIDEGFHQDRSSRQGLGFSERDAAVRLRLQNDAAAVDLEYAGVGASKVTVSFTLSAELPTVRVSLCLTIFIAHLIPTRARAVEWSSRKRVKPETWAFRRMQSVGRYYVVTDLAHRRRSSTRWRSDSSSTSRRCSYRGTTIEAWKIWSYAAARDVTVTASADRRPRAAWSRGTPRNHGELPAGVSLRIRDRRTPLPGSCPAFPDLPALLVAVKLPVLAASMGLTALLFFAVRRISGRDEPARWAALAYWLNPAAIVGGECSVMWIRCCRPWPAWCLLFQAPMVGRVRGHRRRHQPQGILIGPAFALALWRAGGLPAIAQASTTFWARWRSRLPFYIRGALPNMWRHSARSTSGAIPCRRWRPTSAGSLTGGCGAGPVSRNWVSEGVLRKSPTPSASRGSASSATSTAAALQDCSHRRRVSWASWVTRQLHDLPIAAAVGAFTVHAFFVLSPNVPREPTTVRSPAAGDGRRLRPRFRPLLVAVSAIVTLNINYVYGAGIGMGWNVPRMITGIDLSVLVSFVNVGVLIWFACRLWSESRAEISQRGT